MVYRQCGRGAGIGLTACAVLLSIAAQVAGHWRMAQKAAVGKQPAVVPQFQLQLSQIAPKLFQQAVFDRAAVRRNIDPYIRSTFTLRNLLRLIACIVLNKHALNRNGGGSCKRVQLSRGVKIKLSR